MAAEIGKNVTAIQGDVSNLADLDWVFQTVEKSKGKIDILFANAGVDTLAVPSLVVLRPKRRAHK